MADSAPSAAAPAAPSAEVAPNASVEATESIETAPEGTEEVIEASDEGSDSAIEEKADAAAKKTGAKKTKNDTYKIKVDGKEQELSQDEMIKWAQMGKAGQKRMQEYAQLQKETSQFLEALKTNPKAILTDPAIGVDLVKFAQEILSQQLEEEAKSPEQKEREALQKELEDLRAQKKQDEENRKKTDYDRMVSEYEQDLEAKVIEALDNQKLPKKPAVLNRMADIMLTALDNNLKITPAQAAQIAKEEASNDLKELLSHLSDEQIEQFMGNDLVKRLRQSSLKKVKTSLPSVKTASTGEGAAKKSSLPKITMKDFLNTSYSKK